MVLAHARGAVMRIETVNAKGERIVVEREDFYGAERSRLSLLYVDSKPVGTGSVKDQAKLAIALSPFNPENR